MEDPILSTTQKAGAARPASAARKNWWRDPFLSTTKPDFSGMASDLQERMASELEEMKWTLREEVQAHKQAQEKTAKLTEEEEQKRAQHKAAAKEVESKLKDIGEGRHDIEVRIEGMKEMGEGRKTSMETELSELTARNIEMKSNLSYYYSTLPKQIHELSQEVRRLNESRATARYLLRTNRTKLGVTAQSAEWLEKEIPRIEGLLEEEKKNHSVLVRQAEALKSQIQAALKDQRQASAAFRGFARREEEQRQAAAQRGAALNKRGQSVEQLKGEIQNMTKQNEQLRLNYESALASAKMHSARQRQMSMELTKLQPQLENLKRQKQSLKEALEKDRAQFRGNIPPLAGRAAAAVRSTAAGINEAFEGMIGELKNHSRKAALRTQDLAEDS